MPDPNAVNGSSSSSSAGSGTGSGTGFQTDPLALTECDVRVVPDGVDEFDRPKWRKSTVPYFEHDTLYCIVPPATPQVYGPGLTVSVIVGEMASGPSAAAFVSYAPPAITGIVPSTPDSNGELLVLHGTNIGDVPGVGPKLSLLLGGKPCLNLRWQQGGDNSSLPYLTCTSPRDVSGKKNMTLTIAGHVAEIPADGRFSSHCKPEFYGEVGEYCLACPEGGECPGMEDDPTSKAGFYDMQPAVTSDVCPVERRTAWTLAVAQSTSEVGGGTLLPRDTCFQMLPCDPLEACTGNNTCATGYIGTRCSKCMPGEYYRRAGECVVCPNNVALLLALFIAAAVGACIMGYFLTRKKVHLAFLTIGVDYFQVLAMFARTKVAWPALVKDIFHIMSVFNVNLEITAPECSFPDLAYKMKWAGVMILPLGALCIFGIAHWSMYLRRVVRGEVDNLHSHGHTLLGMFVVMCYYLYLYITRTVLDVFNCSPLEPDDGKEYLEVVFEECGLEGGTQQVLLPWAILAFIFYVMGYPAAIGTLLVRNKRLIMEDQILRAEKLGDTPSTNPNAYLFRQKFHKLYYHFKPAFWFWILIIIARKFLIAFTGLMFRRNPGFQLAMALLVMFSAYALQVRFKPYMSMKDLEVVTEEHRRLAEEGHPLHMSIKANILTVMMQQRKVGRRRRNWNKTNIADATKNFFFDYNTVEAVLLACAVLVCLTGIMFESGYLESGTAGASESKDFVTAIILIVIFSSIVYFLTVFVSEVFVTVGKPKKKATGGKPLKPGGGAASGAHGTRSRVAGDTADGEVDASNPMFAAKEDSGAPKLLEAGRGAPSLAVWDTVVRQYNEQVMEMQRLKEENQRILLESVHDVSGGRTSRARVTVTKSQFGAVTSASGVKKGSTRATEGTDAGMRIYMGSKPGLGRRARASRQKGGSDAASPAPSRSGTSRTPATDSATDASAALQQRRAAEVAMGITTLGATDAAGKPLATGWVRKSMGDTTWYENEVKDTKSWNPVY